MSSLILKNVNKMYPGGQQAIRDFNLEIKDREFLILAGPNGCGKSTLLRMIGGLEEITSGTLLIDGQDMTKAEPRERNIAMLFKNSILYPGMSVYENLAFALRMAKAHQTEIDRRVSEIAGLLGLADLLSRMPEELTMADTYRALLGRALMRKPGILLLDSTIAGLDQEVQVQMRQEFVSINKKMGVTVIYVTDNQDTAKAVGTRMLILNDGAICQDDTPENLYERPGSVFVAGFVGHPSMNLFSAEVSGKENQVCLSFSGGTAVLPESKGSILARSGCFGKEVYVGIRPDALSLSLDGAAAAGSITGEFVDTEMVQGKSYIRIRAGESEYLARGEAAPSGGAGTAVSFVMDVDQLHIFDKETEKTIVN